MPRVAKYANEEERRLARNAQARLRRAKKKAPPKPARTTKVVKIVVENKPVRRGRKSKYSSDVERRLARNALAKARRDAKKSRMAPPPPLLPYNKPLPKAPKSRSGRGRPRKYATADEARIARNERARLRRQVKKMSSM